MSYPTTLQVIGGHGGREFSLTGENNGATLQKIWVWVGEWQVKAVKVWLSDGRSGTFGESYGEHQEYKFQPGECFTSLSVWGNGAGTRLGAIKFKTNKGGEFSAIMTSWGLKKEYHMDVGSGYCLGIAGRAGADIDSMGFMFLNGVQSVALTNVNYPTILQLIPKVNVEEIKFMTYRNNSSATQKQKIETSKKITKTSSWSVSTSLTATFSVEVNAGIPKLGEVTAGYSLSVGFESTYSQQLSEEKTETLSTDIDVPSKKKVEVEITIGKASYDLPYTGTMVISCQNGSVLQYETNGIYKGTTYTTLNIDIKEHDL